MTKTVMKKTKNEVSLKDLLEAGCHFGHQARRWNPKMKSYLYDVRDGVHIFDLMKTKEGLEAAIAFVRSTASQGESIVFVGTKRQAKIVIAEEAKKAGIPYVAQRWIGGTITNWEQMKKRLDKLAEMTKKRKEGEYKKYTKKEQAGLDKEIARLEKFFGGLKELENPPSVLFIVDVKKEEAAVREARRKGIIVVAIVDSDSNPDWADYVIPANDDAAGSVKLIVGAIAQAVTEGKNIWAKKSK